MKRYHFFVTMQIVPTGAEYGMILTIEAESEAAASGRVGNIMSTLTKGEYHRATGYNLMPSIQSANLELREFNASWKGVTL